jgi:hypothetical protein
LKTAPFKISYSAAVVLLLVVVITWLNFNQVRWTNREVFSNDVKHYYSYLPAVFYEQDLSLSFLYDTLHRDTERELYSPNRTPDGRSVLKMTMGLAIGFLPFFAAAHLYCTIAGIPPDGFAEPYHFAIQFSSLVYFVLGLLYLRRVLRIYFSERTVALTLFLIAFGTNAFYYLSIRAGNVHTFDFFLAAAFIWQTLAWHQRHRMRDALLLGCFMGMLVLTRPINILFLLFFMLYGVLDTQGLFSKLRLIWHYRVQAIAATACGFICVLPQLCYWKFISGHFLFNSYVGEHFYFLHPHLLKGLFSFRNGWFIYTPIMVVSVCGIVLLRKKLPEFFVATLVLLLVYVYVTFSWWCWWYGGSFGMRALIDLYPLLSIPLALVLEYFFARRKAVRVSFFIMLTMLVLLNLFQTMQAKYNIIHYDAMTWQNYRRVFFTATGKPDREKYLRHPDYQKALRGEEEEQ